MQTPQTTRTIKQFTPKTKILIFGEIWAVTIQHRQQGISSRNPGRSEGEGKGERRESMIFNTTNMGLCSMSNDELLSRNFLQRDGNVRKQNHQVVKRKNNNSKRRSREV